MNLCRYLIVVTLGLCIAFGPAAAGAQELARRVHDSPEAPRLLVLPVPLAPHTSQQGPNWVTSTRFTVDDALNGVAARGAQRTGSARSERGAARKVFGAIVGAAGGFFAGGYLGATIEGDRCHCDDPGLKGAVIGAPIGAVVGAILGSLYLF